MNMKGVIILVIVGDALSELKRMETESVDCCITSPPYYNLRDYGIDGQIGLETTPEEYISKLVDVFREVRRVLKNDAIADSTVKHCSQNIAAQKGSDRQPGKSNGNTKACLPRYGGRKYTEDPDKFYRTKSHSMYDFRPRRNKRDVWNISTCGFKEAHFAVFPEKLIEPCVLAGCKEGGTVLDPFCGSGTTGVVAAKNNRNFIGIELNPEYAELARKRIAETKKSPHRRQNGTDSRGNSEN